MRASLVLCAVFLVVLVSGEETTPPKRLSGEYNLDDGIYEPATADHGNRQRRVTCDLLSFNTKWGSVNHSACAAHCLAMMKGFRGGHCDGNGVCVCRK